MDIVLIPAASIDPSLTARIRRSVKSMLRDPLLRLVRETYGDDQFVIAFYREAIDSDPTSKRFTVTTQHGPETNVMAWVSSRAPTTIFVDLSAHDSVDSVIQAIGHEFAHVDDFARMSKSAKSPEDVASRAAETVANRWAMQLHRRHGYV